MRPNNIELIYHHAVLNKRYSSVDKHTHDSACQDPLLSPPLETKTHTHFEAVRLPALHTKKPLSGWLKDEGLFLGIEESILVLICLWLVDRSCYPCIQANRTTDKYVYSGDKHHIDRSSIPHEWVPTGVTVLILFLISVGGWAIFWKHLGCEDDVHIGIFEGVLSKYVEQVNKKKGQSCVYRID